jgi:fused signal recognition particle receptor
MKKKGLGARIRSLFSGSKKHEELLEDLEDLLIEADLGALTAAEISEEVASKLGRGAEESDLVQSVEEVLSRHVLSADIAPDPARLNLYLIVGVNGTGKTTTLAKLAHGLAEDLGPEKVILAAGDTFRAAAVEQLSIHAERIGVRIVKQSRGADAAAVIFDAIESARSRSAQVVLADTAGRMHNRQDLIQELGKIDRIVERKAEGALYRKLLVVDATTGQNAFRQAELFSEAVDIDAAVLAKYDSSSKGGVVVPICRRLGIPFAFVGTGEKYEDLRVFDVSDYVRRLVAGDE